VLIERRDSSNVRADIAITLGKLNERSIIPGLQRLCYRESLDSSVHWYIVVALNALGVHLEAPVLLRVISKGKIDGKQVEVAIRRNIVAALGNLEEYSFVPGLLSMLSNERIDTTIRVSIADVLGVLAKDQHSMDRLRQLLHKQRNEKVHGHIALALGRLGDYSVIDDLVSLLGKLKDDQEVQVDIADVTRVIRQLSPQLRGDKKKMDITIRRLYELQEVMSPLYADNIHHTLWEMSLQAGVKIFATANEESKRIEIVKWGETSPFNISSLFK
jgi:HEAT repeat protein